MENVSVRIQGFNKKIPKWDNSVFELLKWALKKRLTKSLYTERWEFLRAKLKSLRKQRGLTQAQLAKLIDRPQSLIAKIESGERKLDICQFIDYADILGADPSKIVRELARKR